MSDETLYRVNRVTTKYRLQYACSVLTRLLHFAQGSAISPETVMALSMMALFGFWGTFIFFIYPDMRDICDDDHVTIACQKNRCNDYVETYFHNTSN